MRIAMIVGTFGKISEKFVLDQIAGLIDLGHEVEIFARSVANEAVVHPDVVRYGLREKLHVLGIPSGGSWRYILRALIVAVTVIPPSPHSRLQNDLQLLGLGCIVLAGKATRPKVRPSFRSIRAERRIGRSTQKGGNALASFDDFPRIRHPPGSPARC